MDVPTLKVIGGRVFNEVNKLKTLRQKALKKGAAGDKTYPVDKKAEEIILEGLFSTGEALTAVSEEKGLIEINGGGKIVLIDPIDGSKNAVSGIPLFCTSIAVSEGEEIGLISLSYIINLVNGDEFWAEKGRGAFLNGKKIRTQEDSVLRLVAYEAQSPGRDIADALPLLSEAHKTRCLGSVALDLAYLAAGAVSIFINPSPSRSFDFGGGYLIVKEAGGVFTDAEGGPIESSKIGLERTTSLLASGNPALHEKALKLLTKGSS